MTPSTRGAPPRAALWDLDGTLVDSEAQHWESWQMALDRAGLSVTYQQFRQTFGMRNDAILTHWLGTGISAADIRRISDTKEGLYRELVAHSHLVPLPGVRPWVERLHGGGWRQAVASSAPRANVDVVVRALQLERYFDTTVAAEDVTHGKPDPEVFLTAASRLNVAPARCVVVEDAPAGVEGARRAGMRSVGIGRPGFAPADLVVGSLADVPADTFDRLVAPAGAPG